VLPLLPVVALGPRSPFQAIPRICTTSGTISENSHGSRTNRKSAAGQLRIDPISLKNWEEGRTEIDVRFYPQLLDCLGYDPVPEPGTRGERIRKTRMLRGWSQKRLAQVAEVDEGTVKRLEVDTATWHADREIARFEHSRWRRSRGVVRAFRDSRVTRQRPRARATG